MQHPIEYEIIAVVTASGEKTRVLDARDRPPDQTCHGWPPSAAASPCRKLRIGTAFDLHPAGLHFSVPKRRGSHQSLVGQGAAASQHLLLPNPDLQCAEKRLNSNCCRPRCPLRPNP